MPLGGARGQILDHLIILFLFFFAFIFFMESSVFELQVLLKSDHGVQCPRVGLGVKI